MEPTTDQAAALAKAGDGNPALAPPTFNHAEPIDDFIAKTTAMVLAGVNGDPNAGAIPEVQPQADLAENVIAPARDPATGQFLPKAAAPAPAAEAPAPLTSVKLGDREVPITTLEQAFGFYEKQAEVAAAIEAEKAKVAQDRDAFFQQKQEIERAKWEAAQERANIDALRELARRDPENFVNLINSQALQAQTTAPAAPQGVAPQNIQAIVEQAVTQRLQAYETQNRESQFINTLIEGGRAMASDKSFGDLAPMAQSYVIGQLELARQGGRVHSGMQPQQVAAYIKSVQDSTRALFSKGAEGLVATRMQAKAATTQQIPATSIGGVTRTPAPAQPFNFGKASSTDFADHVANYARQMTSVRE